MRNVSSSGSRKGPWAPLVAGVPPQGQDVAHAGLRHVQAGGDVPGGDSLPGQPPDVVQEQASGWRHAGGRRAAGGALPELALPLEAEDTYPVQRPLLGPFQVVVRNHARTWEPEARWRRVAEEFLVLQHEMPDLVSLVLVVLRRQASLSLRRRSVQSVQYCAPPYVPKGRPQSGHSPTAYRSAVSSC